MTLISDGSQSTIFNKPCGDPCHDDMLIYNSQIEIVRLDVWTRQRFISQCDVSC